MVSDACPIPLQAKVLTAIASAVAGVAVSGQWRRRRCRGGGWAAALTALCHACIFPTNPVLQETLCTASVGETGTSNALGDKQLVADVAADKCVGLAARCSVLA